MTRIPSTSTVVSYAYAITVGSKEVGTLQGFSPTGNRALERVRELAYDPSGARDTIEIAPGRSEFSITIDRLELYSGTLMEVLGQDIDITQMVSPFTITETLRNGNGAIIRTIQYIDCWVNNVSKTVREGTITVAENATLWVTRIVAA